MHSAAIVQRCDALATSLRREKLKVVLLQDHHRVRRVHENVNGNGDDGQDDSELGALDEWCAIVAVDVEAQAARGGSEARHTSRQSGLRRVLIDSVDGTHARSMLSLLL